MMAHFRNTSNMKNILKILLLTTITLMSMMITSCEQDEIDNWKTLKKLYTIYRNGEIDECKYNGQTVYTAGLNAYDAGDVVYDKDGEIIGACNYAWGNVDSICGQLTDCKVIYRVENNIWGLEPVDKYGLKR